jgi:hypothetical protein
LKLRLKLLTYRVKITAICVPVEGKTSKAEEFYDELQAGNDKLIRTTSIISCWLAI